MRAPFANHDSHASRAIDKLRRLARNDSPSGWRDHPQLPIPSVSRTCMPCYGRGRDGNNMPATTWEPYVLVVEDDAALRDLYRSTLRAEGYAVIGVEDSLDALRLVETLAPAAVVL